MPLITDIDLGPRQDQTPAQKLIRAEIGRYVAALPGAPNLDVRVLDYIIGFAATWAEDNQYMCPQQPPRLTSTAHAKWWVLGFLQWYTAANPHTRNDTNNLIAPQTALQNGMLMQARSEYRNIPWSANMLLRNDCLWNCAWVTDQMLTRIDYNLQGETVLSWQTIQVVNLGIAYLPKKVSKAGLTLELGAEIVSDWLIPPNPGHGHPMTTIRRLYAMASPQNLRNDRDNSGTRKSYRILSAGEWIFVLDGLARDVVITFYKKGA